MTAPDQQNAPRGRSPGMIAAALAAVLLLCAGVVAWDQTRSAGTGQGAPSTVPYDQPQSAPAQDSSGGSGFDGLQ